MVNVGSKVNTLRIARACGKILFPENVFSILKNKQFESSKGPILSTAIVAATMAVKNTSAMIPFCHHVPIEGCKVHITELNQPSCFGFSIECEVQATYKTGIEMEALVGLNAAALCIYDMCKALSHDIHITDIILISKSGGKSDYNVQASTLK